MPMKPLWAVAFLMVGGAAAATSASGKKQIPLELALRALEGERPLPSEDRQLRGAPLDVPFTRLAIGAIPLGMGGMAFHLPEDVEVMQGPPIVDGRGSLRDLLDFGSAIGAAVLRPGMNRPAHHSFGSLGGARGQFGGPLELPLDALRVRMQQQAPAPLSVDDSHGKVRIYGTLPKKLTSKSLKVSFAGDDSRSLVVKYFLGQGADAKNVVGIDEDFVLDFTPVGSPVVSYKAATGAFELVLTRPAVEPRKQVAIDFDETSPTKSKPLPPMKVAAQVEAPVPIVAIAPPPPLPDVSPMPESDPEPEAVEPVEEPAAVDATKLVIEPSKIAAQPSKAVSTKVALERRDTPMRRFMNRVQASPKEFVHESKLVRLPLKDPAAVKVELAKVTKDLEAIGQMKEQAMEVMHAPHTATIAKKEQAERVKAVTDKAKQFVADAHLSEAQKELSDAFAPLDLGVVMLEMKHQVRARK